MCGSQSLKVREQSGNNQSSQSAIREHSDSDQRTLREPSEITHSIEIRVIESEPKIFGIFMNLSKFLYNLFQKLKIK